MSTQPELTGDEAAPAATHATSALPSLGSPPLSDMTQLKKLALLTCVLVVCYAKPLYDLVRFAVGSDLFSHVLLIPFISAYLVRLNKDQLHPSAPDRRSAAFGWGILGILVLVGYSLGAKAGIVAGRQDYLAWTTLSFVLFFFAICFWCLDRSTLREVAFPLAFLLFTVPFPRFVVDAIEVFLQHTSAFCASVFFTVTGMSFLKNGLMFKLPNIELEVAPECSGIHSTLVLFISSLVAGQLFLRTAMQRTVLALAVIPLGILRNAFRIWVIGELCVHIRPEMIDSPIHRRGGPLFFLLSLIPFALLLWWLRRRR